MAIARQTALLVHFAGLALGLFIAAMAAGSVLDNIGSDYWDVAVSRIATAASLTSVVLAFALVLPLRGFTPLAPFLFAVSFGLVGFFVEMQGRSMAKSFAPANPNEFGWLYGMAIAEIAASLAIAVVAWQWTYRHSRHPIL